MPNPTAIATRSALAVVGLALLAVTYAMGVPWAPVSPVLADEPKADEPKADPFVVPPGQEEMLADMLGRAAALPGDCKLADGQINGPVVVATYTCASGEVVMELRYPSDVAGAAARTKKFAVTVKSGSPPDGLTDALLARIREREGAFEWLSLLPPAPAATARLPLIAASVLAIGIVAFMLLRRRSAAHHAP